MAKSKKTRRFKGPKDRFARAVIDRLRRAGEAGQILYDRGEFSLSRKGGVTLYLERLYKAYRDAPPEDREPLLDRMLRFWFLEDGLLPGTVEEGRRDLLHLEGEVRLALGVQRAPLVDVDRVEELGLRDQVAARASDLAEQVRAAVGKDPGPGGAPVLEVAELALAVVGQVEPCNLSHAERIGRDRVEGRVHVAVERERMGDVERT